MFSKVARPVETAWEPHDAPFRVLHLQQDRMDSGSFRPDARLALSSALRTSGFWSSLDPADAYILILLLSFLSPNGHCTPALSQVANALHCSSAQARSRLQRLTQRQWQGQSLAVLLPRQDGNDAFAPGPHLLAQEHPPQAQAQGREPRPAPAGRETILAHSREWYAKPRAEVEAGIAERMGWGPPAFDDDPPDVVRAKRNLYGKMTDVGVTREQALDMLAHFSLSQIGRQIDWLPHRNAKNPARFLLAAIEGNYDAPVALKRQKEEDREKASPPGTLDPLPDLPAITEEVFGAEEQFAAADNGHIPLHHPEMNVAPPDEPLLPSGTLYSAEQDPGKTSDL